MKISVATKRPGAPARHVWIENSLENLQRTVGGYIECVKLCKDLAIICDEEGRLKGKEHNCSVCGYNFVGDIIVVGVQGDEFADLPCDWQVLKNLFPTLFEESA